jgi:hypothetical protein
LRCDRYVSSNIEQASFKNIKLLAGALIDRADDQDIVNPGSIPTMKDYNTNGWSLGASPGNDSDNTNG